MWTARIILFSVVLAQLGDALTFTIGVARYGIDLESNGFAATVFQAGGLSSVLLLKGVVLVASITLLATTAFRFPRLLMWGGATATGIGFIGFAANASSLLLLS